MPLEEPRLLIIIIITIIIIIMIIIIIIVAAVSCHLSSVFHACLGRPRRCPRLIWALETGPSDLAGPGPGEPAREAPESARKRTLLRKIY